MSRKVSKYDYGDYDDYRNSYSYGSFTPNSYEGSFTPHEEGFIGETTNNETSKDKYFMNEDSEFAYIKPEFSDKKQVVQIFTREADKQRYYVDDSLQPYPCKKEQIKDIQKISIENEGITDHFEAELFMRDDKSLVQVLKDDQGKYFIDENEDQIDLTKSEECDTFYVPLVHEEDIKYYTEKEIKDCMKQVKNKVRQFENPSNVVLRIACIENKLNVDQTVAALIQNIMEYEELARAQQPDIEIQTPKKKNKKKPKPQKVNLKHFENMKLTRIKNDGPVLDIHQKDYKPEKKQNKQNKQNKRKRPKAINIKPTEKRQDTQSPTTTTSSDGLSPQIKKKIRITRPSPYPEGAIKNHTTQTYEQFQNIIVTKDGKPDFRFKHNVELFQGSQKARISIIIIGHVDAGKSTLTGQMLYLLKEVSEHKLNKLKRESNAIGKGSFHYAWILDEEDDERSRGVTIDVARRFFKTENRMVTILDAPGHKDFIPNMIKGAGQADAAIVVIDASKGEFEKGFNKGGQTREHILLSVSLGIKQFCFVINKLDSENWSQSRFDDIVRKMSSFMKKHCGIDNCSFLPVSGLMGDNIVSHSENTPWYKGPTLMHCIDQIKPPHRNFRRPFVINVSDYSKDVGNIIIEGQVIQGFVVEGQTILVQPSNLIATIKTIHCGNKAVRTAYARDQVRLYISDLDLELAGDIQLLADPEHPIPYVRKFKAQIVITDDSADPIMIGSNLVLHNFQSEIPCTVYRLKSQLDASGKLIAKKSPTYIKGNKTQAIIRIRTNQRIPLMLLNDNKLFGRFTLRQNGKTIAAGIVHDIPESKGVCPYQYIHL